MTLTTGDSYTGTVLRTSQSDNIIAREHDHREDVVICVDNTHDVQSGDAVEFVITGHTGEYYSAVPAGDKRIEKIEYNSSPNIPLHHDGKHGQTIGETRRERHSITSPQSRDFDPETKGAPDIAKSEDSYDISSYLERDRSSTRQLDEIASEIGEVSEFE